MTGRRFSTGGLQRLGRALMLPIAVLPVAGLLLRLGQPDLLNIDFIAAAGNAIFQNLGLLFAIGVATGFAADGNGAAALAGAVCFLVATNGAGALLHPPADIGAAFPDAAKALAIADWRHAALTKLNVPIGILSGLIGGLFYNRFGAIKLPEYLAFFGGRRFVPIVSGFAGLGLAAIAGVGWQPLSHGIDALSYALAAAGPFGLFVYGTLNRLLIVTGLHHILNNIVWFVLGDFHGATGDLNRFFAGDPSAGAFMSGFFPVMIFGLPAACLAMYRSAQPERRQEVAGLYLSLALTALLTGVTEPIEFTFMFLAPVLYAIHAVLTGVAMAVMDLLHVRLGFGFSAGLFDYVLNYGKATRPLLLLPVGAVYAVVYYALFRFVIVRFNLPTPGRDPAPAAPAPLAAGGDRAAAFVDALGGHVNLASIDACTTRLRVVVHDQSAVRDDALKALGARGMIRPSDRDLQVVIGPTADQLARDMRAVPATAVRSANAGRLLAAFGGKANIVTAAVEAGRVVVTLRDSAAADPAAVEATAPRGATQTAPGRWHVLTGPDATAIATSLQGT